MIQIRLCKTLVALALSFVGSVSLWAQSADPFPEVNPRDYYGNMSMTVKVVANGLPVHPDVTVAVYSGESIRGKGFPEDDQKPGVVFLTVCGNSTGEALYFKVHTHGKTVEVTPDDLTYTFNGLTGTPKHPYEIDITNAIRNITLLDAEENDKTLADYDGYWANVTLNGRTLYKDGYWNTICLPFDVELTDEECPLVGATARTLSEISLTDNTLYLTFGPSVNKLLAGVPYIIRWDEDTEHPTITDPTFLGVTVKNVHNDCENEITGELQVGFIGTYSPFEITAENIGEVLYIGSENKMGYSKKTRTLRSCRAHFVVKDLSSGGASGIKAFVMNDGEEGCVTGISAWLNDDEEMTDAQEGWWTLNGVKLDGQPSEKGIFLFNGKKMVIR